MCLSVPSCSRFVTHTKSVRGTSVHRTVTGRPVPGWGCSVMPLNNLSVGPELVPITAKYCYLMEPITLYNWILGPTLWASRGQMQGQIDHVLILLIEGSHLLVLPRTTGDYRGPYENDCESPQTWKGLQIENGRRWKTAAPNYIA